MPVGLERIKLKKVHCGFEKSLTRTWDLSSKRIKQYEVSLASALLAHNRPIQMYCTAVFCPTLPKAFLVAALNILVSKILLQNNERNSQGLVRQLPAWTLPTILRLW